MNRHAVAPLLLCLAVAPAAAQEPTAARAVFENGMAQVVPDFSDSTQWVRERLWVETEFDSDGDGRRDRVHVDVTRPRQTTTGLKVPVVYESSPYFAGTSGPREFLWDVRQEVGAPPPPARRNRRFPIGRTARGSVTHRCATGSRADLRWCTRSRRGPGSPTGAPPWVGAMSRLPRRR